MLVSLRGRALGVKRRRMPGRPPSRPPSETSCGRLSSGIGVELPHCRAVARDRRRLRRRARPPSSRRAQRRAAIALEAPARRGSGRGAARMASRFEVDDELWAEIAPLIPVRQRRRRYPGRLPRADRGALNGLGRALWVVERAFAHLHWFRRPSHPLGSSPRDAHRLPAPGLRAPVPAPAQVMVKLVFSPRPSRGRRPTSPRRPRRPTRPASRRRRSLRRAGRASAPAVWT
jgi:hypothetical protein